MRKALAIAVVGAMAAIGITAGAVLLAPTSVEAQEETAVENAAGPLEEVLGQLVEEGVINQEQADIVGERIRENAQFRPHRQHRLGHLETVAELLDVDLSELGESLRDGRSIADLAGDQTSAVVDALVSEATDHINNAVNSGRLSQEEADEKLATLGQRITDMVNGERPEGVADRRGPGPRGGGFFGSPKTGDNA
jgi:polyhydroxyalkanoate synthesis regulator phasin